MKRLFLITVIYTTCIHFAHAQLRIGSDTIIAFATLDKGKEILTAQDDFVRRMSPFDRAARMKTDRDISEAKYLEFVGKNVLEWNDIEKEKVASAIRGLQAELDALSLPFPKEIFIIKTTGNEEGGAAYTRANAIILPKDYLTASIQKIQKTICHELFHIMSRTNPDLREKLYASIGFIKCDEVTFPLELESRKITNPDAPRNDHCIQLQVLGKECWAIPILFSSTEKYNIERGGEFFNYLQFQFLLVEKHDNSSRVKPMYDNQKPRLVEMKQVSGFFEQVGNNTRYIIHPEEILADNFALMVLQERDLPSPSVLKMLEEIL